MYILGISAYYHDSAAALIKDGKILAAVQEERFTRKKHDHRYPMEAIAYCLREAGITAKDLSYVAFYEKPFLKFERLLETYLAFAPYGLVSFLTAMPIWLKQKLWIKEEIRKNLGFEGKILFPDHHTSHAASAFFPSPFKEAAILTLDGVGEWTTTSYGVGKYNAMEIISDIHFPHSLGLLYSAFTYYLGFKVNSGEYKLMGLAPYGKPTYKNLICKHLIDVKNDGSFHLNLEYFNYSVGLTMTNKKFHNLFGGEPRKPESKLTERYMDIAASIQAVTEDVVLKIAEHIKKKTGQKNICLAGGVALNCVANGKLLKKGTFENIWIQPAAGDAGGALGAALYVWYQYLGNKREVNPSDSMQGSYLGPSFSNEEIKKVLEESLIPYKTIPREKIPATVAELINGEKVVGWFEGRMEYGPRALGARSIIGDARSKEMQKTMNLKIKFRESFRPFAPSVLIEDISKYFDLDRESPYMLLVAPVQKNKMKNREKIEEATGLEKLYIERSDIPAVTHVDYSARIHTVNKDTNPLYYKLLSVMKEKYKCPVIINTSFNVRGEPIVCTPEDALKCFMRTEMDYLIMENCLISKEELEPVAKDDAWKKEYELD